MASRTCRVYQTVIAPYSSLILDVTIFVFLSPLAHGILHNDDEFRGAEQAGSNEHQSKPIRPDFGVHGLFPHNQ